MTRAALAAATIALCTIAAGCSRQYGFDVLNQSDRVITIDIIDTVDGAPAPTRQAVMGPGGHYIENIECRSPALSRAIRIGVEGDPSIEPALVNLAPNRLARHEVRIADGRIVLEDPAR